MGYPCNDIMIGRKKSHQRLLNSVDNNMTDDNNFVMFKGSSHCNTNGSKYE